MISYKDMVEDSLKRLKSDSESQRALASRELIDLGQIHDGTTPTGIRYVRPAPWVLRMFPNLVR